MAGQYHEIQIQAVLRVGLQYIDARDVTQERKDQRALHELNTQLLEKEGELIKLAQRDGLTQLANRRYFDEIFLREWRRCLREHEPLSLIMVDIDHFKSYNDHYGHPTGDSCLKSVASAMHRVMRRPNDLLARYGGEEFVSLLGNTGEDGASLVAHELIRVVEDLGIRHAASTTCDRVTISVGLACVIPMEAQDITTLIRQADRALYHAKNTGRNRVVNHSVFNDAAEGP